MGRRSAASIHVVPKLDDAILLAYLRHPNKNRFVRKLGICTLTPRNGGNRGASSFYDRSGQYYRYVETNPLPYSSFRRVQDSVRLPVELSMRLSVRHAVRILRSSWKRSTDG